MSKIKLSWVEGFFLGVFAGILIQAVIMVMVTIVTVHNAQPCIQAIVAQETGGNSSIGLREAREIYHDANVKCGLDE